MMAAPEMVSKVEGGEEKTLLKDDSSTFLDIVKPANDGLLGRDLLTRVQCFRKCFIIYFYSCYKVKLCNLPHAMGTIQCQQESK